jgi:O-methyltransferase involved in polyketide biosynthesis
MIIFGAGYYTCNFRLDLPQTGFQVWEADQTEVQLSKQANLDRIAPMYPALGALNGYFVRFVSVDFKTVKVGDKTESVLGFLTRETAVILKPQSCRTTLSKR